MASQGIVFEQAITQAPNTWVSHAGILTGLYPPRHGLRSPYDRLDPNVATLASLLSEQGHATAGFPGNDLIGSQSGFHKGFDLFFENYHRTQEEIPSENGITANHCNLWEDVLEAAHGWIKRQQRPYFVWFHYLDTHHLPHCNLPDFYRFGTVPEWQFYEGKISYADQRCIRSVLDILQQTGTYDKTLIVVLSDHGEELNPGLPPCHNSSLSDGVLRVPMIMFSEEIPWKGVRIQTQVRTIDLMPTILLLVLGITGQVGKNLETFSGYPLPLPGWISAIRDDGSKRHLAYAENEPMGLSCIRADSWKFIRGPDGEKLYHLISDQKELRNAITIHPNTASYFRKEMEEFLSRFIPGHREPADRDVEETHRLLRALGYLE
jgi:arylsulfatase A-like enzyme